MFGKRKFYTCPKCHKSVMLNGDAKHARCPQCQNSIDLKSIQKQGKNPSSIQKRTKVVRRQKSSVKTQGLAKYTCTDCDHAYLFDGSTHTPTCPKCRSERRIAMSPAARVVSRGNVGTVKQQKRQKYEARSIRHLTQLREQQSIALALMKTMNMPAVLQEGLGLAFDVAIAGMEKEKGMKMERYNEAGK